MPTKAAKITICSVAGVVMVLLGLDILGVSIRAMAAAYCLGVGGGLLVMAIIVAIIPQKLEITKESRL